MTSSVALLTSSQLQGERAVNSLLRPRPVEVMACERTCPPTASANLGVL